MSAIRTFDDGTAPPAATATDPMPRVGPVLAHGAAIPVPGEMERADRIGESPEPAVRGLPWSGPVIRSRVAGPFGFLQPLEPFPPIHDLVPFGHGSQPSSTV
jgi:hypothetical protein